MKELIQFFVTIYAFLFYNIMIGQVIYLNYTPYKALQVRKVYLKYGKLTVDVSEPYSHTTIGWLFFGQFHVEHPKHITY